jgi:hypothetical protein
MMEARGERSDQPVFFFFFLLFFAQKSLVSSIPPYPWHQLLNWTFQSITLSKLSEILTMPVKRSFQQAGKSTLIHRTRTTWSKFGANPTQLYVLVRNQVDFDSIIHFPPVLASYPMESAY